MTGYIETNDGKSRINVAHIISYYENPKGGVRVNMVDRTHFDIEDLNMKQVEKMIYAVTAEFNIEVAAYEQVIRENPRRRAA